MTKSENKARVCVPICARRADELPEALTRAAEFAYIIYLRLD